VSALVNNWNAVGARWGRRKQALRRFSCIISKAKVYNITSIAFAFCPLLRPLIVSPSNFKTKLCSCVRHTCSRSLWYAWQDTPVSRSILRHGNLRKRIIVRARLSDNNISDTISSICYGVTDYHYILCIFCVLWVLLLLLLLLLYVLSMWCVIQGCLDNDVRDALLEMVLLWQRVSNHHSVKLYKKYYSPDQSPADWRNSSDTSPAESSDIVEHLYTYIP